MNVTAVSVVHMYKQFLKEDSNNSLVFLIKLIILEIKLLKQS